MYKFNDENMKNLEDAFGLLNQIEVKGLQNVNTLGNIAGLLQKFFNLIEKIDDPIPIITEEVKTK